MNIRQGPQALVSLSLMNYMRLLNISQGPPGLVTFAWRSAVPFLGPLHRSPSIKCIFRLQLKVIRAEAALRTRVSCLSWMLVLDLRISRALGLQGLVLNHCLLRSFVQVVSVLNPHSVGRRVQSFFKPGTNCQLTIRTSSALVTRSRGPWGCRLTRKSAVQLRIRSKVPKRIKDSQKSKIMTPRLGCRAVPAHKWRPRRGAVLLRHPHVRHRCAPGPYCAFLKMQRYAH